MGIENILYKGKNDITIFYKDGDKTLEYVKAGVNKWNRVKQMSTGPVAVPVNPARANELSKYLKNLPAELKKSLSTAAMEVADAEADTKYAKKSASDTQALAVVGVVTGIALAAGIAGTYGYNVGKNNNDAYSHGHDDGVNKTLAFVPNWVKENNTKWNDAQHKDLESMVTKGNWTSDFVSASAKELFNTTELSKLNNNQLQALYGHLMFESGMLNSPAAKDAALLITDYISTKFGVSKENLTGLDLFGAVVKYGQLASLEAESKIRKEANTWNASWYEQGKQAILSQTAGFNWTNYMNGVKAGENNILNQTPFWNATNFANGHNGGFQSGYSMGIPVGFENGKNASLTEILSIVNKSLTKEQLAEDGTNITQLLEDFANNTYNNGMQNLRMREYMLQVTPKALDSMTPAQKNDTINIWTGNVNTYANTCKQFGWDYFVLDGKTDSAVMTAILNDANISAVAKNYTKHAINNGDYIVSMNTTNDINGSTDDVMNGSYMQRFNGKTYSVDMDGKKMSDADFKRILAHVRGG